MAFDFANFRAGNVASNAELADSTGLTEARTTIAKAAPTPSGKKVGRPKGSTAAAGAKKRKAPDTDGIVGERRSTRSRVVKEPDPEKKADIIAANEKAEAEQKAADRAYKHEARQIYVKTNLNGAENQESFEVMLKELSEFQLTNKEKEEDDGGWKIGERPVYKEDSLEEATEQLNFKSIAKVTPERIYSLVVHPDPTKDLVFAGDKYGHIALWDATHAGEVASTSNGSIRASKKVEATDEDDGEAAGEDEVDEEPSKGKFWLWQAHNKSSVSSLKFRPNNTKKIYSSCYDSTLRSHDFETGISEEVVDADSDSYDGLLHSFDFDPTGNEIWASDGDGGLHWRDLREPITEAKRWDIDRAKVGCVSINPANPGLAATAHLKRDLRIWDLNALRGCDQESTYDVIMDQAMIVQYAHDKACSSAYFDPSGTRLLSTSYDDCLRVWDIDPHALDRQMFKDIPDDQPKFEPTEIFSHNCQVGRFVTVLRAFWSPLPPSLAPPHIHVGSMRRAIDLYTPTGIQSRHLTDEAITAVPAVTACHPTVAGKYFGGSASGKIAYFSNL